MTTPAALARLARDLIDPDAARRATAARTLGTAELLAGDAAVALALVLDDADATVRQTVVASLRGLPVEVAVAALAAHARAWPDEASCVLRALGYLDHSPAARLALEAFLEDARPLLRTAAARALGRKGDAAAVMPLCRALGDDDEHVRAAAASALAVVGAERALAPVADVLTTGGVAERAAAVDALGLMSDARALPIVAGRLADPAPTVRRAAVAALALLPEPGRQLATQADCTLAAAARERAAQRLLAIGTVAPLAAALAAVERPGLRAAAARALGRLGTTEAVRALVSAVSDDVPEVRAEAIWMLGVSGRDESLAPLLAALAADDGVSRAAAARALGRLGQAAGQAALERAANDPDPAVAASARRALAQLVVQGSVNRPSGALLQVVVIRTAPAPNEPSDPAAAALEELLPEALQPEADLHVVTMADGAPLPTDAEALSIVRRRFRTPPAGAAWQVLHWADAAGLQLLIVVLRAADEA